MKTALPLLFILIIGFVVLPNYEQTFAQQPVFVRNFYFAGNLFSDGQTHPSYSVIIKIESKVGYAVPYSKTVVVSSDSQGRYVLGDVPCYADENGQYFSGFEVTTQVVGSPYGPGGGGGAWSCYNEDNYENFLGGVVDGGTTTDLQNAGYSCPAVGEPVNVSNGNMWLEQNDYQLSGIGENIKVKRFYNSATQESGMFGKGWKTDYDESIVESSVYNSFNYITLRDGTGRGTYFVNNGSNVFPSASIGVYDQVVKNVDGTYTLTFKDGRVHHFLSNGKLAWQKDRNGNQTTLSYDTSGFLMTVTDAFGRALNFTPNTDGTISQIGDAFGTIADYEYYPNSNILKSVTYPDNSKFQFEYTDINGNTYLTEVKDALGNILEEHQYDTAGRAVTSEKDGGVEKYIFDYTHADDTQPSTTVTDALGRETVYRYDRTRGRNVVIEVEGNCNCGSGTETTQFEYDDKLNMVKKTDALNRETNYTYDSQGNPLTVTDFLGTETYTYNSLGEVLTRTDRMNGVWTNTYDTNGNLLTVTDPLSKTTTIAYNTHGQPLTVTDARNKTTTFSYDTSGRLAEIEDANSKSTTYAYDGRSRVTGVTDALNQTTNFEYDLNNRLKKIIYPDTNFVTYTYDTAGRRTGMTDERNNTTTYAYDNAYRLTSVTDALNHQTTFGYDLMSNLTSQTDALSNVTNYEYDDFDRLKKVIYPLSATGITRLEESLTYDAVGNVKTRTDTAGRVTNYDYDNANRLVETIDALNKSTEFTYNARSQMTKVKDALNQEYEFTFDALGRTLTQTRANSTLAFEYDAVGNRTKRTDDKSQVTDYIYDNLNRLTTITYQTSTPSTATYAYDDLSRLTSATNPAGTISFVYDNRNRLTQTTDVHGKVLNYTYDAASNRTELKIGTTAHTAYVYDVANRLTQLTDESNQNYTFGYDIANRLISKTLPNGISTTYNYDGMSRLTKLKDATSSTTLFERDYAYNTANQINQIAEPSLTRNFSYDDINRLTQVTNPTNPSESYAYDGVGNRTSSHLSASYTHQANNKLTADANNTYVYDANGNLTSKTTGTNTWTYVWDYENRLTQITNPSSQNVQYEYDALGRRTKRTENTNVTKFTYDGMDVVLDDDTSTGITTYQNGLGIDNKLKLTNGATAKYFLQDHLGSTNALTDASGAVISSASYDSFGNSINTLGTRYQFTGREKDDFSGLYYYRARWYDSNTGRFISEDPIGFDGGDVNLFGYVWNNPTKFTDPTGLDGGGNDAADWLDERIEFARKYWQYNDQEWFANGVNNSIADAALGFSDLFRVGSGTGDALFDSDDNGYGRMANIARDIQRASGIFAIIAGGGIRLGASSEPTILNACKANFNYLKRGGEYPAKGDFRVAPFGNRTTPPHPIGKYPHYHRQGPKYLKGKKKGQPLPGQGKGRHRPWESSPFDKSFWDRF